MTYFAIGLLVIAAAFWALGAFQRTNTGALAKQVQYGAGLGAIAVAGILAIRGNLAMAMQGLAVVPLFAGYDHETASGRIFSYDVTGGR